MTEREYQQMLDVVDDAINAECAFSSARAYGNPPSAANDNQAEWDLVPFPDDWTASP